MSEWRRTISESIRPPEQLQRLLELLVKYRYHIAIPVVLVYPLIVTRSYQQLGTEIAIFAIFAMGYNLLQGYTGVVSFGHALFLGLGAYTSGVLLLQVSPTLPVALGGAVLITVVVATLVGLVSIKREGVYFAMISLAFAQMAYTAMFQLDTFGGYNGLPGIPAPAPLGLDLIDHTNFYYLVLLLAGFTFFSIKRIVDSPFGLSMILVRENQERAASLGYNVNRVKIVALALSAFYAAIAGGLLVISDNFVSPDVFYFTHSADVIFMVLIGGGGSLVGPVIGAAALILIREELSGIIVRWRLVLGLLFILFTIRFRSGVMGALEKLRE